MYQVLRKHKGKNGFLFLERQERVSEGILSFILNNFLTRCFIVSSPKKKKKGRKYSCLINEKVSLLWLNLSKFTKLISRKTNLNSDWSDKIRGRKAGGGGEWYSTESWQKARCMKRYGSLGKPKVLSYGWNGTPGLCMVCVGWGWGWGWLLGSVKGLGVFPTCRLTS